MEGKEESQIFLLAVFGSSTHQTIRICSIIKKKAITILIDSGSTHNFLDRTVAKKKKNCKIQHVSPMTVSVADGTKIINDDICQQLKWNMQGEEF